MRYAEPKDVNYTIQILKTARDKLISTNEEYHIRVTKMIPSINRMILELDQMLMSHDMENRA
jgi:hypothetical protein